MRRGLAVAALVLLSAALGGCRREGRAYGQDVDAASAVALASFLAAKPEPGLASVTVSGTVTQVCPSGCWFTLEDQAGGRGYQLLVDLKPAASFLLPRSAAGRLAVVRGRLVRTETELRLHAVGLRLR